MKKIILLVSVVLFGCVGYAQAQTSEKKLSRQERKEAKRAMEQAVDSPVSEEVMRTDIGIRPTGKAFPDQVVKDFLISLNPCLEGVPEEGVAVPVSVDRTLTQNCICLFKHKFCDSQW